MEAPEAANERAKLLTCLRKAMSDPEDPFPKGVDSAVWACLWFADLEKIRVLVSKAEKGGHERTLAASPLYDAKKMLEQIKFCKLTLNMSDTSYNQLADSWVVSKGPLVGSLKWKILLAPTRQALANAARPKTRVPRPLEKM